MSYSTLPKYEIKALPNGIYKEFDYYLMKRSEETGQKPLTQATLKKYQQQYNFLTKSYGDAGQNWILEKSQADLINILYNLTTGPQAKANYNNIIILIRQAHGFPVGDLQNFKLDNLKSIEISTGEKLIYKQDLPGYKVIKKFINDLYKTGEFQRFIVNFIIYEFGLRNKDVNLSIVTGEQFNNLNVKDKELHNFIIVHSSHIEFYIDDYKTRSSYGVKRFKSNNTKLNNAVCSYGVGPLLKKKYGDIVKEDELSYYIKLYDLDGLKLTEGDYYKIRLFELGESENPYRALGEISVTRGSKSLATLNTHYNINKK
jgi:hypothetical protein